jgi:hypothetical protein
MPSSQTPLEENSVSRKVITCEIELQHRRTRELPSFFHMFLGQAANSETLGSYSIFFS